jgi:hypothetical protein
MAMHTSVRHFCIPALVACLVACLVIFGCDVSETDTEPELVDLTGSWELVTTITSNTCWLPDGETKTEVIYLENEDSQVSITNFDGLWGTGEVAGGTLTFVGTERSDEFGCPATTVTEGTGLVYETEITGTLNTEVSIDSSTETGHWRSMLISCSTALVRNLATPWNAVSTSLPAATRESQVSRIYILAYTKAIRL